MRPARLLTINRQRKAIIDTLDVREDPRREQGGFEGGDPITRPPPNVFLLEPTSSGGRTSFEAFGAGLRRWVLARAPALFLNASTAMGSPRKQHS